MLISTTENAKNALYEISRGDCRRIENILQSSTAITKKIDEEIIYSLSASAKPKEIKQLLEMALNNDFVKARDKLLETMLNHGLSGMDIIKQIQREIMELSVNNKIKMELISKCGDVEFHMTEGSDEYLQLESFLAYIALKGDVK